MNKKKMLFLLTLSTITQADNIKIESIYDILPLHPEIQYIKCYDAQPFQYTLLPISRYPQFQPHEGLLAESFILKIPNGQVGSTHGWVKIDGSIIEECVLPYWSRATQIANLEHMPFENIKHIKGRVATITMRWDDGYFHWICHTLSRLALLEQQGIEYDWLFVAQDKPYMKELLALWGINPAKIIQPFGNTKYIQADELIMPCHTGMRAPLPHQYPLNWVPLEQYCKLWNIDPKTVFLKDNIYDKNKDVLPENISLDNYFLKQTPLAAIYFPPYLVNFMQTKFMSFVENTNYNFSKKVFISRADAPSRKMINEDEVFALFEQIGFKRYTLSNMSVLEQFSLFNRAEIIVGAHGAGLVNLILCKPHTTVIEIFQSRSDACFCYLSQACNLDYHCIQTMEFKNIEGYGDDVEQGGRATTVPLHIIKNFIDSFFTDNKNNEQ